MVICSAKRTKRKKIVLQIDGEHLFTVEDEAWGTCGLSVGQDVSQQQLDALLAHSYRIEAKRRALSLLAARSYTSRRLIDRLASTTGTEAATEAVERMVELGIIDDAAYADRLACGLYENRYYAVRRIRFELHKHGIPCPIIDRVILQFDPEAEPQQAIALLRARFAALRSDADRRRAAALLERYGYCAGSIRAALQSLSSEETEE